jgi:hypothetical protein
VVLEVTRDGAVLELTLNRPDALNAFTVELHQELATALETPAGPASARCWSPAPPGLLCRPGPGRGAGFGNRTG